MKRLRKQGASRKYEFYKLEDAKAAARQYAKEDSIEYAIIRPLDYDDHYEIIPDDFRKSDEGLETIPSIVWHTTEKD